jgi:hypothetical protein
MRIESLNASFEDSDVKGILDHHMPVEAPVKDVSAHFVNQGIVLSGRISKLPMSPKFEATIHLRSAGAIVFAGIVALKPAIASRFKGMLIDILVDKVSSKVSGVTRVDDCLQIEVSQLLEGKGIKARIETLDITCSDGLLKLELTGTGDC